jgi:hypothetical protein
MKLRKKEIFPGRVQLRAQSALFIRVRNECLNDALALREQVLSRGLALFDLVHHTVTPWKGMLELEVRSHHR